MKTVAIVGLSDNPARSSYMVGLYLKNQGSNIIPVNPTMSEVFGIRSYASILDIPNTIQIDIVDIFRRSDQVIPIIKEIVKSGRKPLIWMQEGVVSSEAKALAEKNGLEVVMNMCIMKEYKTII